ncbi:NHLP bacteriocin system secretion protein [Synechocystis salina LEGE 06155]|nr:NHLP bacteriocin system secretion protein [Synechocystis salina LEGE 06155]
MTQNMESDQKPQESVSPPSTPANNLQKPTDHPVSSSQVPRKSSVLVRALPVLVLAAAFVGWGFMAQIPVKIVGQSIIIIPRSKVDFQARSSGRIVALEVQPGDRVTKGQVLAIIEASEIREELLTKQQQLAEYEAENLTITAIEQQRSQLKVGSIGTQAGAIPVQIKANQQQIKSNQQEQIAIDRQRKTYRQRLQQIDEIDKLIAARFEAYNTLVAEGAVAPLDPSRIQAEDVLQKNLNEKTQLLAKLEDLTAKGEQLSAQNKSLAAQNTNLVAQLENLGAQKSEISLDDLESDTKRRNTIDNLKREIANIRVKLATTSQIVSEYNGEVSSIAVNLGQYVQPGTSLGTVQVSQKQETQPVALAFFTPENADRLDAGMTVEVTPNRLTERRFGGTRERFGGIVGTITDVSQETMTPDEVTSLVGNPELAEALMTNPVPYSAPDPGEAQNLPVVQVEIQLKQDTDNITGYQWVSGNPPPEKIPEGSIGEARVTIEERSPIDYVTPLLRWITGIYHK